MRAKTEDRINSDLARAMRYANVNEDLREMCRRCEEWCGEEHDYQECIGRACFTFWRAFYYLDYFLTWED